MEEVKKRDARTWEKGAAGRGKTRLLSQKSKLTSCQQPVFIVMSQILCINLPWGI
jgi:hypothetical protein